MRTYNYLILILLLSACGGLLLASTGPFPTPFTGTGTAGGWYMYGMDHGGNADDIQKVYHDGYVIGDYEKDAVWVASLNTGVYRSEWNDVTEWGDWEMYLSPLKANGIDAIELSTPGFTCNQEYVLCASSNLGLRYAQLYGQNPINVNWGYPNGEELYPDAWKHAATADVAFYWSQGGFSVNDNPEQKYYTTLNNVLTDPEPDWNPGLYRWNKDLTPPNFVRVDAASPTYAGRQFFRFHRDLADPNVLYVTSPDGIYKLSGHYGREMFVKLPEGARLEDLPVLLPQDIKGFDQLVKHFQK